MPLPVRTMRYIPKAWAIYLLRMIGSPEPQLSNEGPRLSLHEKLTGCKATIKTSGQNMRHFKASETTLFFNTRDEMIKVKLDRVAYFEADSNYCHVMFINGAKATLLTSLVNIEKLLSERFKDDNALFIRIGRRYIINRQYIFQINLVRQRLMLSDYACPNVIELTISKESLKNLKLLYTTN